MHKQVLSICRALHDVDSLQESHLGLPNLNMSLSSGPGAKNAVHECVLGSKPHSCLCITGLWQALLQHFIHLIIFALCFFPLQNRRYLSRIQGFLSTKVGFSISPGPSTLPGAGTGVHVQGTHASASDARRLVFLRRSVPQFKVLIFVLVGHVPAGAVVAFYPGLAYNREDIDVLAERVKSRGHQVCRLQNT